MNLFGNKSTTDSAAHYQPTDGDLTNKQITVSVWLLKHRETFVSVATFALILWCIITIGYSTYRWLEYAILGYWQDRQLLDESVSLVASYSDLQKSYTALPLRVSAPSVILSGEGTYDLVSTLSNSNERHIALVTFVYTYANTSTEPRTVAILPMQTQVAAELGLHTSVYPGQATLRILSTAWQRISPHSVFDVRSFMDERLNIETTAVAFTPSRVLSGPTDQLTFTLKNNSAYSLYQVNGYLLVRDPNNTIVGIRPLMIDRFLSQQERSFDLRFLSPLNAVSDIEFLPLVNIFDESNFIKPGA